MAAGETAAGWLAPVNLLEGETGLRVGSPQIALDGRGNAIAAWASAGAVHAALRPATSGSWRASVELAAAGEAVGDTRLALDARGDAVLVWEAQTAAGAQTVQEAIRPARTRAWSAPVTVFASPGPDTARLGLAVDADGEAVAVWESHEPSGPSIVRAAIKPAGSDAWGAPVELSGGEEPQVAIDGRGDVLAVWRLGSVATGAGQTSVIQAAARPAGSGRWRAPIDLSTAGVQARDPRAGLDAQGRGTVVWERIQGGPSALQAAVPGSESSEVQAIRGDAATGVWGTPASLSTGAGQFAGEPEVAVDPGGTAAVVWQDDAVRGEPRLAGVRRRDGRWLALALGACKLGSPAGAERADVRLPSRARLSRRDRESPSGRQPPARPRIRRQGARRMGAGRRPRGQDRGGARARARRHPAQAGRVVPAGG